jgi:polyhydroxyalkanoate synthesis regulator protein
MRDRIAEALGGGNQMVENLTRQNLAIFERAMQMFSPFSGVTRARTDTASDDKPGSGEVDALKKEMEAMRRQISELSQRK